MAVTATHRWVPYGSHSGAAAIGAVVPAWVAVAQLHLRRWQSGSCTCVASARLASASVAVNAAVRRSHAVGMEQRHWLHSTCQPIVSRSSCDLGLAGCHMAVTAAQRQSAQLHLRGWQSQRRQSLLRFALAQSKSALALFKRLPYGNGSHSGAAAIGAVAPA